MGFSLVEILVVLTIMSLLMAVGVPRFNEIIDRSRMVALANGYLADLAYARTEAVGRSESIAICPYSATTAGVCGANPLRGWAVIAEGSSTLLRSTPLVERELSLFDIAFAGAAGATGYYLVPPIGAPRVLMSGGGGLSRVPPPSDITVTMCSRSHKVKAVVTIKANGRASTEVTTTAC